MFANYRKNLALYLEASSIASRLKSILEDCGFVHYANPGARARRDHSLHPDWAVLEIFDCLNVGHEDEVKFREDIEEGLNSQGSFVEEVEVAGAESGAMDELWPCKG